MLDAQLPYYVSHKIVRAALIDHIGDDYLMTTSAVDPAPRLRTVGRDWIERHKPTAGGFFVMYEDGYSSYSPAAAFDSGYRLLFPRLRPDVPRHLAGHKVNPANDQVDIMVLDEPGHGGACHDYLLSIPARPGSAFPQMTLLQFQNGAIAEAGVNGITHEALLAILIDRLQDFQRGGFACRENALALTKLQEAQMWLLERTRGRMARGVEGTHSR